MSFDALRDLADIFGGAARPVVEDDGASSLEHMYKPAETIFAANAREMVAAGWSIFPQEATGRRMPGRVNGEVIRWVEEHRLVDRRPSRETLELWRGHCATLNTAVVFGPASGNTFAIDIDVVEETLSSQIQELAERLLGPTPLRRVGRWPKIALIYRHHEDDEVPNVSPKFSYVPSPENPGESDQGLEVLSAGKPMTFFGKHHVTGRYFRWLDGTPDMLGPESTPVVTSEKVAEFIEAVDVLRAFHRSPVMEEMEEEWVFDETQGIYIPRLRAGGTDTRWVENDEGKVSDGREAYLTTLSARVVTSNRKIALDSVSGQPMLAKVVEEEFRQNAVLSGRWTGNSLRRECLTKVKSAARSLKAGKLKGRNFLPPEKDGKLIRMPSADSHIPPQPRNTEGDSLDFLPPFVDTSSPSYVPHARYQRSPIKCKVLPPAPGAKEEREIQRDRRPTAEAVSSGLMKAFKTFWDEVYDETHLNTRVHILKAPTGAGKTSRGISFIAEDPRTKDDYTVRGSDGEIIFEGRSPILFLLPTYANIEELRHRSQVLNLDSSLSDNDLRKQAEDRGLIHEDDLPGRLAELRRDAKNAGLETMIYQGKLKAGCQMADKVAMAMEAGIGTAGFCKAEKQLDEIDPDTGKPMKEEILCPYYNDCEAIKQKKRIERSHVVFMPHAFLSLNVPEELQHVRAVVADERIHHLFLHTATLDSDTFNAPRKPPRLSKKEKADGVSAEEFGEDRRMAVQVANDALMRKECPVEALLKITEKDPQTGAQVCFTWVESALRVCGASIQRDGTVTPDITMEELEEICSQPTGTQVREEYRFWKIVYERMQKRRDEIIMDDLRRAKYGPAAESPNTPKKKIKDYRIQPLEDITAKGETRHTIRISWRETPNWVDRPLLLLDASAAPDMISKIWSGKEVVVHDIPASLNVRIVAIADRTYSNASVVAPPSATKQEKSSSGKLLQDVRRALTMTSALYGWSRVVAGGSILVRRTVNLDWEGPHNIDWCHFGAMRGLDFAKFHAAAISVGRMELPIRTIDGLVAALTYDDDDPEEPYDNLGTGLSRERKPLMVPAGVQTVRMRSGHDVKMAVPMFPGKWGRMIQRQYREEELLQFLGRLRPVYREGDAPIWFSLSSVIPEEVIVDDIVTLDDFLRQSIKRTQSNAWEAMRRGYGVLDAELAATTCPDLYKDRKAATTDLRSLGLNPIDGSAKGRLAWSVYSYRWRCEDETGHSFVRGDIGDPEAALREILREILGKHISNVELLSEPKERTLARGRKEDKIEVELGSLQDRRESEREHLERVAMKVLMQTSRNEMEALLKGKRLPLRLPTGLEHENGRTRRGQDTSMVQFPDIEAKETINKMWKALGVEPDEVSSEVPDLGVKATLEAATNKSTDMPSYEQVGDHLRDMTPEALLNAGDLYDTEIPY
ncbi:bifunctional DNA primase/polymerase [Roseibium sp. RKSG952]|uniref:bifunctional DNA primase/polymerase n=1 Tax=Roseibium sp. RKSG952 TaxID=2529384 RepID=UPI0012BC0D1C|nr:bifunctional DNA primase/polymerase [Roseibium sp. RKSG952]